MSAYCLEPGCPELVRSGRCPKHHAEVDGAKDRAIKARTAEARKVYKTARWQRLRKRVLREQPWCQETGCNQMATDVDHIVPISRNGPKFARSNLQSLCHKHHSAKTWQETLYRG